VLASKVRAAAENIFGVLMRLWFSFGGRGGHISGTGFLSSEDNETGGIWSKMAF